MSVFELELTEAYDQALELIDTTSIPLSIETTTSIELTL